MPVAIAPRFQIDPALFASSPIDRIRLQARDAATRVGVGAVDRSVDPAATQWSLSLGIDLGGQESRVVIVEAELFAGSTVAWSGRLGPFTVPTAAPALGMDIYPGPLDNLDVLSLNVVGAPSQLVAGGSVTLTAELTLVTGSDAAPIVQWASTNPTVATVTPTGSTVTLTALTAGTADIVASVGTQDFQFTLTVLPPGTATKTWVGGAAGGATSWSVADNWSPTGVPSPADAVLIPATANGPVLSVAAQVNDLTVSAGATLDLGDLSIQVTGDLQAVGAITYGTVVAGGTGGLLSGTLDGLYVSQSRSVTGSLVLTGGLEIAAPLSVGAQTVSLGGSLTVLTGGRLVMTTGGSIVNVAGDAVFAGDSEDGFLTAGLLIVGGNFTAGGSTPTAFVGSGTHSVGLGGSAVQTIDLAQTGPSASRFNNLFIDNSGAANLAGNAYASGNVVVSSGLTVAAGQSFGVGGTLTLEAGSTLNVDGAVTAASCVNLGATITGAGTQPCGAPPGGATKLWIGGQSPNSFDWSNPANWSPAAVPTASDTVLIQGSSFNPALTTDATIAAITVGSPNAVLLGGFTLTVTGDAAMGANGISGGLVSLTGPGTVSGYVQDLEVRAARQLVGTLYVGGGLSIYDVLDLNGNTMSTTGDLLVQGAGNLVMTKPADYAVVYGNATFDGADQVGSLTEGTLVIVGDLTVTASTPTAFASTGNHAVQFSPNLSQSVSFAQPSATEQRLNNVTIASAYGTMFTTDAYASGSVTVNGKMVVPAGVTVTIAGTLTLSPAATLQIEAGGTLVATSCSVDPGALIFGGGTFPCGLSPVSADRVWVGGTTAGETLWDEPTNWSPAGVPQSFESVLLPPTPYPTQLSGPAAVGSLLVGASASLDLGASTLTVTTDLNVQGNAYNGLIQVVDVGAVLQGFIDNLRIDAPRDLSGQTVLNGTAEVNQKLTVGDQYLYVSGDLLVSGSGEVVMDGPNGVLTVGGTASLGGLRADLTAGIFYVGGDLVLSSLWTPGALVYLVGSADQTVTLTAPGVGEQYFTDLYVGTNGVATFSGDVFVTGSFLASYGTLAGTGILEVQGTFYATGVTFQGLRVRIDTSTPPGTHVLSDVTFTGYAATDTQLYIRMPGSTTPFTLTNLIFSTVPPPDGTTGHYLWAENSVVGGTALTIELNNPMPLGVKSPEYLQGTNTIINWP